MVLASSRLFLSIGLLVFHETAATADQYSGACPQVGGSCTLPGASNLVLLLLYGATLFASVALWDISAAPSDLVASKGEWCDLLRSIHWRRGFLFLSYRGLSFSGYVQSRSVLR